MVDEQTQDTRNVGVISFEFDDILDDLLVKMAVIFIWYNVYLACIWIMSLTDEQSNLPHDIWFHLLKHSLYRKVSNISRFNLKT